MKVSSLVRRDAVTCTGADTLARAAQLMWEHDIGFVVVTDDHGRVNGVVTDRDACMAAYTTGARLADVPVTVAMAKRVYTCRPDDDLRVVERTMGERQIRRVPVVDADGRPVAVISLNDIARASLREGVPAKDVAATLAAVCAPRPAVASAS